MSLSFKHFAYCIVCVIIFGCILAVFGRVESGGNTGLKEIFASKFPEGKDEYKEYAKGCMIQGSYRKIAVEPSKVEGVFASTNYYELTIDKIESYILTARSRSDVGNLLE